LIKVILYLALLFASGISTGEELLSAISGENQSDDYLVCADGGDVDQTIKFDEPDDPAAEGQPFTLPLFHSPVLAQTTTFPPLERHAESQPIRAPPTLLI